MASLTWSERNTGRHGVLLNSDDHKNPPNELFFSSRIEMYLELLDCIPFSDSWISSLPQVDIGSTVPRVGPDCPICYLPYLQTAKDESLTDDSDRKEIPLRLPCGHILCEKCVRHLAWDANASTGVLCPFCRASFNHILVTPARSWETLFKCMWVALEIYIRLHDDEENDEEMESVVRWAQDFPRLSHDVPSIDMRVAIEYAAQYWLDMGDEKFGQELAVTVLGPRAQVTPPVVRLCRARRCLRRRRASTNGSPTVPVHTGDIRMSRSQNFQATD